jgi:predicted Kef-type K+ transport protein
MHNIDLILTLVGGFSAALVLGFITHKLGLSPIVGYLIAGIVVGPQTPGFVANREMADQLAEIGVVLLMFGVGLQFHFKELLAVKRIAIPGAVVQSAVAAALGTLVAHAFGWSWAAGFIFGLAIAVASTVVLTRVLVDNNELHTPTGHIAIGWLVMEDLFTVFALVMLPAIFGENAQQNLVMSFTVAGLKIIALVLVTIVGGGIYNSTVLDVHCAYWLARTVYARYSRHCARYCRQLDTALRCVDGARCVSCRHGRRGDQISVCVRRMRRCRCAMLLPCSFSSQSACCSITTA